MKRISKKKYYETWEQYTKLIEKKKFNDSFVNPEEIEEKRLELLEYVGILQNECATSFRYHIAEGERNRFDPYMFHKTMESYERLRILHEKLVNQCEDIKESDYRNTYVRIKNYWFLQGLLSAIVLLLFYFWIKARM